MHGHCRKLAAVEGDLTHEHLGFSDADYQRLQNEVQVFINVAGLVDFDPPFDDSLWGNALAAKHVVNFAKGVSRYSVPACLNGLCLR